MVWTSEELTNPVRPVMTTTRSVKGSEDILLFLVLGTVSPMSRGLKTRGGEAGCVIKPFQADQCGQPSTSFLLLAKNYDTFRMSAIDGQRHQCRCKLLLLRFCCSGAWR